MSDSNDKPFQRELRYYVLKISDVRGALSKPEQETLNRLCDIVNDYRKHRGKEPIEAVVVEHDWPEYESTWAAIQRRVESMSNSNETVTRKEIVERIGNELDRAYAKHGRLPWGRHEFYAILKEEVDEMWDAIKKDDPQGELHKEAIQVAAMVFRYMETGDRYQSESAPATGRQKVGKVELYPRGYNCPYCKAPLLWSDKEGTHCANCGRLTDEEIDTLVKPSAPATDCEHKRTGFPVDHCDKTGEACSSDNCPPTTKDMIGRQVQNCDTCKHAREGESCSVHTCDGAYSGWEAKPPATGRQEEKVDKCCATCGLQLDSGLCEKTDCYLYEHWISKQPPTPTRAAFAKEVLAKMNDLYGSYPLSNEGEKFRAWLNEQAKGGKDESRSANR